MQEVIGFHVQGSEQHVDGGARAGSRVADIETLALEILELLHAGAIAGHNGQGLRIDGEDGTQVLVSAAFLEAPLALDGVVLHVRLDDGKIDFTLPQRFKVVGRSAAALDGAADAMVRCVAIDEAADGFAGDLVNPAHAARADTDRARLGRCIACRKCRHEQPGNEVCGRAFHQKNLRQEGERG